MSKITKLTFAISILTISACQSTSQTEEVELDYLCDKEQAVKVYYAYAQDDSGYARVVYGDSTYHLDNVAIGSGVKYSDQINTWWSKGPTGVFMAGDRILLKNCIEQSDK
jgi:membrane-bound inhibitor of C-type lysozyme